MARDPFFPDPTNRGAAAALALTLTLLALAGPAFADHREAALGGDGALYVARVGAATDLFPGGLPASAGTPGSSPGNTVLALDIVRPGAATQRLLVPGTAGNEVESSPTVVYEDDTKTVFLVWETVYPSLNSTLSLASFDGTNWSSPIVINGNPFAGKTPPQVALTRDTRHGVDAGGNPITHHRTVIHLVWAEETHSGLYDTFYTPIILEDGSFLGLNQIFDMTSDIDPGAATATTSAVPAASSSSPLVYAPTVQTGRDDRTVVIGFASSHTGLLNIFEIDVLPEQLTSLAEKTRSTIIDIGLRLFPGRLQPLADQVSAALINYGAGDFQPEVLGLIAGSVHDGILQGGGSSLINLADGTRSTIIDIGARLAARGLRSVSAGSATSAGGVPAPSPNTQQLGCCSAASGVTAPTQYVQFRFPAPKPVPAIGSDGVQLFLSRTGDNALVAWSSQGNLLYIDTRGGSTSWNDVHQMAIPDGMDLTQAYTVLEQRVRN